MTSRVQLGVQQRHPHRPPNINSSLAQRSPAQRRALSSTSQAAPASSPLAKETVFDLSDITKATTQTQHGTPRKAGSKLRRELSSDGLQQSPTTQSPARLDISHNKTVFTQSASPTYNKPVKADTPIAGNGPMLFPPRRPRFSNVAPDIIPRSAAQSVQSKQAAKLKPYTLEAPPTAPHYSTYRTNKQDSKTTTSAGSVTHMPGINHADFYPWTGDHPEDRFNESVIRNGYFDKNPIGANETASAKNALFPILKHKNGLSVLSTVFAGVLSQRRQSGQITAPSTFKPPPRVTLTDTKREIWLKDLANSAISLRRLSRTIPHGIRGKVLLDQCLQKSVPTDRAVWLAKCVGANDIRAFKRKGVNGPLVIGGEAKWIKDWTVFVEQFVDGVVSSYGDAEWKAKVNYAVRLATHLYAEHLLDRDHYSEWLVSGLEGSTSAKLPMWLVMTQIYWKDLCRLRKFGRRLATAMLHHLDIIRKHADQDVLAPLQQKLVPLIKILLNKSSHNFVVPETWLKYGQALRASIEAEDTDTWSVIHKLDARNRQLVGNKDSSICEAHHRLIDLLDDTLLTPMSDKLPANCWSDHNDKHTLVKITLDWATSIHRPGSTKVFVAHRLLSHWHDQGLDITAAILDYIATDQLDEIARKKDLYLLVSELVRTDHFSALHYTQWLVAHGGIREASNIEPDGPVIMRLMVELPVNSLSPASSTMRSNALARVGYSVDDENDDVRMAVTYARQLVSGVAKTESENMSPPTISKLCRRLGRSSQSLKSQLGEAVLQALTANLPQSTGDSAAGAGLSLHSLAAARLILEAAEDYVSLGTVLKHAIQTSDSAVVAYATDAIHLQLHKFAAIGLTSDLFEASLSRLRMIVEQSGIAPRPLLLAISSLAVNMPDKQELAAQLKQDLVRSHRTSTIDACSPVSDSAAAGLQDSHGELHEEIEKLLMSGTSMDRITMNRLFGTIISKLQACWTNDTDLLRIYSNLMAKLRLFDAQHVDSLMMKWALQIRNTAKRPPISRIFPTLITSGCLDLKAVFASTNDPVGGTSRPSPLAVSTGASTQSSVYAAEVLDVLISGPSADQNILLPDEVVRFQLVQLQAPKKHFSEMLSLLGMVLCDLDRSQQSEREQAVPKLKSTTQRGLTQLLCRLVLIDASAVSQALASRGSSKTLDEHVTTLLCLGSSSNTASPYSYNFQHANAASLPFCKTQITVALASSRGATPDSRRAQLDMLLEAMDTAIDTGNTAWTALIAEFDLDTMIYLHDHAQERFFRLLPAASEDMLTERPDALLGQRVQTAQILTTVLGAIVGAVPPDKAIHMAPSAVDRIADILELLIHGDAAVRQVVLGTWLPLLLTHIKLYSSAPGAPRHIYEVRAKLSLVLVSTLQELDCYNFASASAANSAEQSQHVFDTLLILVDGLPDDVRLHCVRVLGNATNDARLRYIYSFSNSPNGNLMLSHKVKPETSTLSQAAAAARSGANTDQPRSNMGAAVADAQTPTNSGVAVSMQKPQPPLQQQQQSQQATPAAQVQARVRGAGFVGMNTTARQWCLPQAPEKLTPFTLRRWEILNEPTPIIGENDTSLSLTLFEAIKLK